MGLSGDVTGLGCGSKGGGDQTTLPSWAHARVLMQLWLRAGVFQAPKGTDGGGGTGQKGGRALALSTRMWPRDPGRRARVGVSGAAEKWG